MLFSRQYTAGAYFPGAESISQTSFWVRLILYYIDPSSFISFDELKDIQDAIHSSVMELCELKLSGA